MIREMELTFKFIKEEFNEYQLSNVNDKKRGLFR